MILAPLLPVFQKHKNIKEKQPNLTHKQSEPEHKKV